MGVYLNGGAELDRGCYGGLSGKVVALDCYSNSKDFVKYSAEVEPGARKIDLRTTAIGAAPRELILRRVVPASGIHGASGAGGPVTPPR